MLRLRVRRKHAPDQRLTVPLPRELLQWLIDATVEGRLYVLSAMLSQ
jgi:hypothetical protein